jgi:zinc transport system permease protein
MDVPGLTDALNAIVAATEGSPWEVSGFALRAVLAVLAVSVTCGLVGTLVVGNRMAFFSDAMAHTAFAGVALALLGIVVATGARTSAEADGFLWVVPLVMVGFGAVVGVFIAFVREQTQLTNDTVIGVFFALSIGFGAMFLPALQKRVNLDIEQFLLGGVNFVHDTDLALLLGLAVVTAAVVGLRFNALVFGSFNPSLARSRGLAVRANNYLFIVLLALVVNLSIRAVGVLLINALLVVPAAAAANLAGNLRQMFWLTLAGSVGSGLAGYVVSTHLLVPVGSGAPLEFGPAGTIVVVCVAWFFATMLWAAARRRTLPPAAPAGCPPCPLAPRAGFRTIPPLRNEPPLPRRRTGVDFPPGATDP